MNHLRLIEARVDGLLRQPLGITEKGVPYSGIELGEVGSQSWSVPHDVPLPALALRWDVMLRNVERLQSFCRHHGALLAPHGKTTMAPQIFLEQLRAGAWAITVASGRQALVCYAFGVPRILLANEVTTEADFALLARLLADEAGPELYVYVDSPEVVQRLAGELRRSGTPRPLHVLIEFGFVGGRGGVRRLEDFDEVAKACISAGPEIVLAGVSGYEGIIHGNTPQECLRRVDAFLLEIGSAARRLRDLHPEARVISAGGSVFFDRVVELLGSERLPDSDLVVRSGAYVTHDHGVYQSDSPLGSSPNRRLSDDPLEPALELWSTVVSKQEPELAILGFGRRDGSVDSGNPVPLGVWDTDRIKPLPGATISGLNDQHAYLRLGPESDLKPGDAVVCGISHPCTVFEKWRTILTVDDRRHVTGAVRTFF